MKKTKKHVTKQPEPASPETFLETKTALAQACRIGRHALNRYLSMADAPVKVEAKGWPVALVKQWILHHARGTSVSARHDPELAQFQKWEIYEKARRLHIRNLREDGTLMPVSEHESELRQRANAAQALMAAMPSRLAPELVGLTVPECEIRLRHYYDKIVAAVRCER